LRFEGSKRGRKHHRLCGSNTQPDSRLWEDRHQVTPSPARRRRGARALRPSPGSGPDDGLATPPQLIFSWRFLGSARGSTVSAKRLRPPAVRPVGRQGDERPRSRSARGTRLLRTGSPSPGSCLTSLRAVLSTRVGRIPSARSFRTSTTPTTPSRGCCRTTSITRPVTRTFHGRTDSRARPRE
jgi:hypothetical protein